MNTAPVTETVPEQLWRLGPAAADFDLCHVRAVTPTEIVDDARIVVRDALIREVATARPHGGRTGVLTLDGAGLLVLPGLIDVHSDALEREHLPRPTAPMPWEFAFTSLEGRLVGAGVTTCFHGAAFQHQHARGASRSVELARELCGVVDTAHSYRVDHRVLHRLDILSEPGARSLRERLDALPPGTPPVPVSHEDHTPGQGQYADPSYMIEYIIGTDHKTREEAEAQVERLVREGEANAAQRTAALRWLWELAVAGRIRLLGHDPDSAEAIDELHGRGGAVAEFPTTLEAARRAREHGMHIVAGAPNMLRGTSHSGNISARELLEHGLLDALASDYLPAALLGGVWTAVSRGITDLPHAVSLVTSGPAAVVGLDDRGVLAPGHRADLTLVDDRLGDWPRAVGTVRSGVGPGSTGSRPQ